MDRTFVHCHLDVDCSTIFWFWVEKYVYSEPVMSFRGTLSQKGGICSGEGDARTLCLKREL
jgi:hypothetical protein